MRLIPLMLFAFAASAAHAADDDMPPAEMKATMAMTHQHMVVNFVSGIFYCENKRWPADIAAVRAFSEEHKIKMPVTPEWEMIQSSFSYTLVAATDEMIVRSPKDLKPDAHGIISTNQAPGCNGKHVELKAGLHIE